MFRVVDAEHNVIDVCDTMQEAQGCLEWMQEANPAQEFTVVQVELRNPNKATLEHLEVRLAARQASMEAAVAKRQSVEASLKMLEAERTRAQEQANWLLANCDEQQSRLIQQAAYYQEKADRAAEDIAKWRNRIESLEAKRKWVEMQADRR